MINMIVKIMDKTECTLKSNDWALISYYKEDIMNEIICPNCSKAFKVDEVGFAFQSPKNSK